MFCWWCCWWLVGDGRAGKRFLFCRVDKLCRGDTILKTCINDYTNFELHQRTGQRTTRELCVEISCLMIRCTRFIACHPSCGFLQCHPDTIASYAMTDVLYGMYVYNARVQRDLCRYYYLLRTPYSVLEVHATYARWKQEIDERLVSKE